MVALTIGMATYDDFDGVYFSIQALRLYQDLTDSELVVVDNFGCPHTRRVVEGAGGTYLLAPEIQGTAAPRDLLFRAAAGEAVLCLDSHVMLMPDSIARLREYYAAHPGTIDLLQGPLIYDDLETVSTHFDPVWQGQMWGTWGTDPRGLDPDGAPFEIPNQGLGLFSCRREAWPGFNPLFRGFGGEEGYIHEKFRQLGGRALCLPWLGWIHRFSRPRGVPYRLTVNDKLRNYLIGHTELGLDLAAPIGHFAAHLPPAELERDVRCALIEIYGAASDIPPAARAHLAPLTAAVRDSGQPPDGDRFLTPPRPGLGADFGRIALQPRPAQPLVSCLLPTFNRPASERLWLVEEAVESFLRQDYPNKELIILNDCAGQTLTCDAPGVRVVNTGHRAPSLGDKRNELAALATGDLLCPWDDDDISLPWRLSLSVARLGDGHYWNPRAYWFLDAAGLHSDHTMGVSQFASMYSRLAYTAVRGTPSITLGEDQVIAGRLLAFDELARELVPAPPLSPLAWFYIYRWGVSDTHLSSRPDEAFWQTLPAGGAPGEFAIRPHWRQDYVALTRQHAVTEAPAPVRLPPPPGPAGISQLPILTRRGSPPVPAPGNGSAGR